MLIVITSIVYLIGLFMFIVISLFADHDFTDTNWRDSMYTGLFKIRKWFGINLFYELFKFIVFILWVVLYPFIFLIKLLVEGFGFLWLFKKIK